MSDVVERIAELIAEEKCPHCDRDWHQQALTKKVANMFESGYLDPNYFAYADTSPILCDGSGFIGPLRPEPTTHASGGIIGWNDVGLQWPKIDFGPFITATQQLSNQMASWAITSIHLGAMPSAPPWVTFYDEAWNTVATNKPCDPAPEVDVEFGPQNWHYEFQRAPKVGIGKHVLATHWTWSPTPKLAKRVCDLWKAFKAIPAPTPRGYDFSAFTTSELTNTGPKKDPTTKGRRK